MRDKIWYEMVHCKYGENYLAHYIYRQKSRRKVFKIITLVFSTSGILGWKLWEYAPVIACGLIAIMQLLTLVENQLISSDQDLDDISELRNKYTSRFNEVEELWISYNQKKINDDNAREQFYKLRQIAADIEALDNKIHINGTVKKLVQQANIDTSNYFNQFHS